VNLLKKGVKNVIAMNGTNLPETVKELSREKDSVVLFVDGDRGGNLIIKNVVNNAKVDFIAMAPEGKEVEELTGKEILQSLRKKIPVREYRFEERGRGVRRYEEHDREHRTERKTQTGERKRLTAQEKEKIRDDVEELVGTKGALIFNKDLEVIAKIPMRRLPGFRLDDEPYVIAIDGTATKKIIEVCEELGCHNLIASNFISSDTPVHLESM
jgi:DNA primase